MATPSQVFLGLQVPTSSVRIPNLLTAFRHPISVRSDTQAFKCTPKVHMLTRGSYSPSLWEEICGRLMLWCPSRDVSMACSCVTHGYEMLWVPDGKFHCDYGCAYSKLKWISVLLFFFKPPCQLQCIFLKIKMASRPHRDFRILVGIPQKSKQSWGIPSEALLCSLYFARKSWAERKTGTQTRALQTTFRKGQWQWNFV